jgi:hypothetical protein
MLGSDDTQMSAPVLTLHLLSAEERACPHTTYVRELASQTLRGFGDEFGDAGVVDGLQQEDRYGWHGPVAPFARALLL